MEFVKMSKKGQLVVPASLRKILDIKPEDKFIAYGEDDYIIFKKIELPSLKKEFDEIFKMTSEIAKKNRITPKDVKKEIKEYRNKKKAEK